MKANLSLYLLLLVLGAGWGVTIPLAKIAVSTGHQPLGLVFWQLVVMAVFLAAVILGMGKRLVLARRHLKLFAMVALMGAVLPDFFYYLSAIHLSGGVMSILASTSPMFSLPIALMLANESYDPRRLMGLVFGFAGILLLVGPEASLPEGTAAFYVMIALLAPALYATEGNLVMKWGTQGLDPIQVVFGAAFTGMFFSAPLALASGQWVNPLVAFGAAETALVAGAALNALIYSLYVGLVGKAGSVFVSQSAYLVTAFGVVSSMVMLGERYSIWVWLAFGTMMLGMFLVQPRAARPIVPARVIEKHEPDDDAGDWP